MKTDLELSAKQLRKTVDPATVQMETTKPCEYPEGVIGQDRAVQALNLGLGMREMGFNVYVSGPHGIGKMTAIQGFLERLASSKDKPSDWCYVNNFEDTYSPRVLRLPPGQGRILQQGMKDLIEHIRREIPKVFESEEYAVKKEQITRSLEQKRSGLVETFTQRASEAGFLLQITPVGIALMPLRNKKTISDAEFQKLPPAEQTKIQEKREQLQKDLQVASKELSKLERETRKMLQDLDRNALQFIVVGLMDDLFEKFINIPEVIDYLKSAHLSILENIEIFKSKPPDTVFSGILQDQETQLRKYQVNVMVDNGDGNGAPVVVELNPTYNNLFGKVEKESHLGALYTDFTLIKAGALHRANGGYLILQVEDLLRNPFSWDGVKRMLRGKEIQIEELAERLGYVATKSLRPQPIPLDAKVLLVGPPYIYHLLLAHDPDFPELFKIKAEFDTSMKWTDENTRSFLTFLCTFCEKEGVRKLTPPAVARLLEHASRMAEDKDRLSTHFGILADVIREANFWAQSEPSEVIDSVHVQKALDSKVHRSNLVEQRFQELIVRGTLLIDLEGEDVGQVNGLSVIDMGDYYFGRVNRISASVGPGREGIVDIERESKLGGPIHTKGVLILSGYLMGKFAREMPLTLSARLVFEQSYHAVEGDSASSTELYALLSALAGVPIKQGLAVTGSISQFGEVQAIGGVNEKIEGFFELCKLTKLTGEQGVIIPESNIPHLMLREDVVQAVKENQFHIWAVKNVDQGMEILTGISAGEPNSDGTFPSNSINDLVQKRLQSFTEYLKKTTQSR